jgi:hypothetical protein
MVSTRAKVRAMGKTIVSIRISVMFRFKLELG